MNILILLILNLLLNFKGDKPAGNNPVWPITNERFGSQIIHTPGSYIGKEYNEFSLFIGGKKGSYVVSPVDGKIVSVLYGYLNSLKNAQSFSEEYFQQLKDGNSGSTNIDPKYVTLTIGIEIASGDILYFLGIDKYRPLKTGAQIRQGDTLGLLSYAYKEIKAPSLIVGRSLKGINADPMTPLGLKTTFKHNYHKINPLETVDQDKLVADFLIFRKSLEEGHPGLYDYIAKPELDKIFDSIFQSIDKPMNPLDFEDIMALVVRSVRDGHLQFLSNFDESRLIDYQKHKMVSWPLRMGWKGDILMVTGATEANKHLLGSVVKSINGISADSLKKRVEKYCYAEGFVKSSCDFFLFTAWLTRLPDIIQLPYDESLFIVFDDGTNLKVESYNKSKKHSCEPVLPSWARYIKIFNRSITYKLLNDSTAFLDLSTFKINDIQNDTIFDFVKEITTKEIPNVIIDVRYNDGGDIDVLTSIFSLFAREPFRLSEAEKVNSNGTYDFFQHTQNYAGVEGVFASYQELKGKSGYWLPKIDIPQYLPNDTINYKGNIYILANEESFSAASMFAALMRKYSRGLIIGRETANPYHQMYADKFAHVQLPNTQIVVRIPLVKTVFDTTINAKVPFGRGVLPDYEIPFYIAELEFKTDAYIEKAKDLIARKIYLEPQNSVEKENGLPKNSIIWILAVMSLGVIIVVYYFKKRRREES